MKLEIQYDSIRFDRIRYIFYDLIKSSISENKPLDPIDFKAKEGLKFEKFKKSADIFSNFSNRFILVHYDTIRSGFALNSGISLDRLNWLNKWS